MTKSHDAIHHPSHYTFSRIEVIDAIEAWGLGYHLGNAVKYIARAAHKGSTRIDLMKARWYLDREIQRLEANDADSGLEHGDADVETISAGSD